MLNTSEAKLFNDNTQMLNETFFLMKHFIVVLEHSSMSYNNIGLAIRRYHSICICCDMHPGTAGPDTGA